MIIKVNKVLKIKRIVEIFCCKFLNNVKQIYGKYRKVLLTLENLDIFINFKFNLKTIF